MKYPGGKKQHFRHLLFFTFHQGQKAVEAAWDICMVYREGVIGESMQENGLQSSKMAILTSTTHPTAEDLLNLTKTISKQFLKEEICQTSLELAKKMNCDQKKILTHFHSMGFAKKLGVWVPHELSKNNKENCLQIASQHRACHQATRSHKQRFLYRIVTGDEKWCLYINMKQKRNGWLLEIHQS